MFHKLSKYIYKFNLSKRLISIVLLGLIATTMAVCDKISDIPGLLSVPPADLRPRVLASFPSPQASTVGARPEIFVEFDREMETEATGNALIITGQSPPAGAARWAGNRVYFDLDDDLVLGNAYILKVSGQAKSSDGYAMEVEYIVHFIAGSRIDAPEVTAISPATGNQGVLPTAIVTLYFSRAMEHSSVETAFRISPSISGAFTWPADSRSLTFTPYSNLSNATTYSITLSVGAKDQEGISIVSTYNSSFQVGSDFARPVISEVRESGNPTAMISGIAGVYKDSAFELVFSEAMDFISTQNAFSLSRLDDSSSVAGIFQWNAAFERLVFTPAVALEPTRSYRLKVSTAAEDQAGNALDTELVLDFTVDNTNGATYSNYLSISSIQKTSPPPTPQNFFLDDINLTILNVLGSDLVPGGTARIEISFTHGLDPASILDNVSISRVIGLNNPTTPGIKAVQLQTAGAIANGKLVLDVETLGNNEYRLRLFGGRNGLLSTGNAGETGTFLSADQNFYFKVLP